LIRVFGVDVLIPVVGSETATAFVARYPHLRMNIWRDGVFKDQRCEFVDVRHAARRATGQTGPEGPLGAASLARPVWSPDDPLSPLLAVLFGYYPNSADITIDYAAGLAKAIEMPASPIEAGLEIPGGLSDLISPIKLTGFDISVQRDRMGWLDPGIVMGDAGDFDSLLLLWNLQAAGATICLYDPAAARLKPYVDAFVATVGQYPSEGPKRLNFWFRTPLDAPWDPSSTGLALAGVQPVVRMGGGDTIWNGITVEPMRPQFSFRHHDVVPSYAEDTGRAVTSFALADLPFDDHDPRAANQRFVVTVDATQYGQASDDLTFETPFVPRLNEFYGRNFYFKYDHARAELARIMHIGLADVA
jgi:hypothetical protein